MSPDFLDILHSHADPALENLDIFYSFGRLPTRIMASNIDASFW